MIYLSDLDWVGPDDWDRPTWKNRKDGRLYCILDVGQAQHKAMEQIVEGREELYVKEGGEPSHPVEFKPSADRTLFPIEPFPNDRPMSEHPFYGWLVENEENFDTRHFYALDVYLKELGFDIELHRLDPEDLDLLRLIQEHYGTTWMPRRSPATLKELFIPGNPDIHPDLYWLRDGQNLIGTDNVALSDTLVSLIEEVAPIYELSPRDYYFEVVNGVLFLKYQHIIGSRRLCPIEDPQDGKI